ncbi:Uma2 family endonuclease [Streptomyces sp. NPDC048623]|uniref:Uma2 family endonuclease n=1 Tax=Streptomyces sp. NPDC048623 TaxID=3155761 RepID=UPI00344852DE
MGALMSAAADDERVEQYVFPTPPAGGWTADDLDRIPGLPPHTELIDGGLFFVSPQTYFHMATTDLLVSTLRAQAPADLDVVREMTTKLGDRDRPEPDLMVVRLGADDPDQTWFKPEDIVLAVEIVSTESLERDREIKPRKYAAARIPHFWRVERNDGQPIVFVYELDPATNMYAVTGIHHDRLKVTLPFEIDIDLTAVNRRRGAQA